MDEVVAPLAYAGEAMRLAMALAIGLAIAMWVMHRKHRSRCQWCGKRHPDRPEKMTTEEFLRIHCGGWKALNKQREVEWKRK